MDDADIDIDVYTVGHDSNNKWYPNGPGNGFGYYGGLLYPNTRYNSAEEVKDICVFLNVVYQTGYEDQKIKTLEVLGLNHLLSNKKEQAQIPKQDPFKQGMFKIAYEEGRKKYINDINQYQE